MSKKSLSYKKRTYLEKYDDYIPGYIPNHGNIRDNLHNVVSTLIQRDELDLTTPPKSSNYTSVVFIGKNQFVFQLFGSKRVHNNIVKIISKIPETITTPLKIISGVGRHKVVLLNEKISFLSRDYLPLADSPANDPFITWQKITPLNSFKEPGKIVRVNIDKFMWDINKALLCLHTMGYIHNDCTLDNIGINNQGNFCLFDFDGTKVSGNRLNDFDSLNSSLKFHGLGDVKVPKSLAGIIYDIYQKRLIIEPSIDHHNVLNAFIDYFENLKIVRK